MEKNRRIELVLEYDIELDSWVVGTVAIVDGRAGKNGAKGISRLDFGKDCGRRHTPKEKKKLGTDITRTRWKLVHNGGL